MDSTSTDPRSRDAFDPAGARVLVSLNVEDAVRNRYTRAARTPEPDLCCPTEYDGRLLEIVPPEILERDYGCGDPSRHIGPGETVLDLGSGAGKICYIAAQIVGREGRVIGVDANEEMLALARRHQAEFARRIGYANVEFRKGRIQDVQLDLDRLDEHLAERPVRTSSDWLRVEEHARGLRATAPLVADASIDVVVSNCVLNLVRPADRPQLFAGMHRVLKRGGRAVVSDIVADEDVPGHLQQDPELWSGCLSGAFREDRLVEAFEEAGFYGCEIVARQAEPWAVIEGIEFRSVTVRAWKGKDGPCLDRRQAVIYRGPWKAVIDDDGHTLVRGQRMAVCDKTFQIYTRPPYAAQIIAVPPLAPVPLAEAEPFSCRGTPVRSPRETKAGPLPVLRLPAGECCGPSECC
ncbi:MAG TPA: methyltransferase domain-containing protein [Planctomycetaceae bacterium]|nr:methyltransferase domain-containing protein [Planctomycetaceae bacterium]